MTECAGVLGRIFGHRYSARISVESSRRSPEVFGQWMTLQADAAKAFAMQRDTEKRTYHGDVCSRCGNILNLRRVPPAPASSTPEPDNGS